jgi:membrane associated rhomboid family serine protease
LLLIPYSVDVYKPRTPIANFAILILMAIAYAVQTRIPIQQYDNFVLKNYNISGILGYMWLHGSLIHIIGNMLFLWVFGNAVCARVGNFKYLIIYICCGAIAGLVQIYFSPAQVVGASGAIFGIVGIYLILFPFNTISYFFWFGIGFKRVHIAGFWLILFDITFNIIGIFTGYAGSRTAYVCHIGGFAAGLVFGILLVLFKMVVTEDHDAALSRRLSRD